MTDALLSLQPMLEIPKFEFFSHAIETLLANLDNTKMTLAKAVNRITNDDVIIQSLNQAIVMGEITLPDATF